LILILTPLLLPLVQAVGVDPVHFGIIWRSISASACTRRHSDLNLFASQAVFQTPLGNINRGVLPFLAINFATLLVITYVPAISMVCSAIAEAKCGAAIPCRRVTSCAMMPADQAPVNDAPQHPISTISRTESDPNASRIGNIHRVGAAPRRRSATQAFRRRCSSNAGSCSTTSAVCRSRRRAVEDIHQG